MGGGTYDSGAYARFSNSTAKMTREEIYSSIDNRIKRVAHG